MFISSETWHNQSGCDLTKKKKDSSVTYLCSGSSVQWDVSEYMVRFFLEKIQKQKKKTKKFKKKVKFKNRQMRKSQGVWQSWSILLLFSIFFFFLFPNGFTKKYMTYLPPPSSENKTQKNNANQSHSIIASLISPKALSCTLVRRGSAVFSLASMSEVYT